MKWAVGIFVFLWVLCGLIGAYMNDDLDADHWKEIAWGPITLTQAMNDNPTQVPGLK